MGLTDLRVVYYFAIRTKGELDNPSGELTRILSLKVLKVPLINKIYLGKFV